MENKRTTNSAVTNTDDPNEAAKSCESPNSEIVVVLARIVHTISEGNE